MAFVSVSETLLHKAKEKKEKKKKRKQVEGRTEVVGRSRKSCRRKEENKVVGSRRALSSMEARSHACLPKLNVQKEKSQETASSPMVK
jgi:hypothetical protein